MFVTYIFNSFRRAGQTRVGTRTAVLVSSFHNLSGLDIFNFFVLLFGNLILGFSSSLNDTPTYATSCYRKSWQAAGSIFLLAAFWPHQRWTSNPVATEHRGSPVTSTSSYPVTLLKLYPKTATRGFPLFASVLTGIHWEGAFIYSTIPSTHFLSNPLFTNSLPIRSVVWATNHIVK